MVSVDFYINETTRHAHLILPPTYALERDHFDLIFHVLAIRNTVRYSTPLFEKAESALHDWQIFERLISSLAKHDPSRKPGFFKGWVDRWLTPRRSVALGIRLGGRGAGWNPFSRGLTLGRVLESKHGIDLGPLEPCLPARLQTPNQRINLVPVPLVADLERLHNHFKADTGESDTDLLLIGRRDPRTNNSWLHNAKRFVKGPERCTLLMHPGDAARRQLRNGDLAAVNSRTGKVEIPVEVTEEMMPGVVSIPHGWGHHRPGLQLRIATQHAGVSVNDLTDETFIDSLSGNSALNGVAVRVSALAAHQSA